MKNKISAYISSHSYETQAVMLMLVACFWFSVMAILIRYISFDLPPFEMVFFRNLFSVVCITPWIWKMGFKNLRSTRWDLYSYRAISGVAGMTMLFYALSIIPLTDAISLTFTVPLITTLLAIIFLGEKVSYKQWVAILTGFLGVMVILRPNGGEFNYAYLLVIITTFSWSASNIFIKKLTITDNPKLIVILMTLIMTPLSLPMALTVWQAPTVEQLGLLFALGWVSNQAQITMTKAYSKADMNIVLPFDFSRLVFITTFAYFFFGEVIDAMTVVGACIIFMSSLYIVKIKKKTSK